MDPNEIMKWIGTVAVALVTAAALTAAVAYARRNPMQHLIRLTDQLIDRMSPPPRDDDCPCPTARFTSTGGLAPDQLAQVEEMLKEPAGRFSGGSAGAASRENENATRLGPEAVAGTIGPAPRPAA